MAKKMEEVEMAKALEEVIEVSYDEFGSHSYATGWLLSTLLQAMKDMPAHKQREIVEVARLSAARYKK